MMRKIMWWVSFSIAVSSLLFLLSMLYVYSYSFKDDTRKADVAIVLGAAVWLEEPSPVFQARIDHGVWLYKEGYVDKLIFTGGKYDENTPSESSVAKTYAIEQGVPPEDIYIEEISRVTIENIRYAEDIMEEESFEDALIVSDPLHMSRAMAIAGFAGLDAYTSPTRESAFQTWKTKFPFLMHETTVLSSHLFLYPATE